MKRLFGLLTIALSFGALASTTDTRTIVFDDTRSSFALNLRAEKTHTEYRTEAIRDICYRTVTRHRTVCSGTGPNRTCHTSTHYDTVPYSCIRYVQVPFEVFDYHVDAKVQLDVAKLRSQLPARETLIVSLHGEHLTIRAQGSKKFLAVAKTRQASQHSGSVKLIDAKVGVELIEAQPILGTLKLSNIAIKDDTLTLAMGALKVPEHLSFSLKVEKKKLLGSNPVLIDREIALSEMQLSSTATETIANLSLSALGLKLDDGKYEIEAKARVVVDGEIINSQDFEALSASGTLIYTNRK